MTWSWVGKARDEKIKELGNLGSGEIAQAVLYAKQVY